jgi:large subunit ribosomal protein L24
MPLSDVRLVVPYEFVQTGGAKIYRDVIVDKVRMVRHTTGIDPFTGTDYGNAKIPKDHQYDPRTGLPIFHRYIAGTQHRIEWPWEKEQDIEDSGTTPEDKTNIGKQARTLLGKAFHPVQTLKEWNSSGKEIVQTKKEKVQEPLEDRLERAKHVDQENLKGKPKSKDPGLAGAYDNDTTVNVVEGGESMSYTLIDPPFPDTLREEIRSNIKEFAVESNKKSSKKKDADEDADEDVASPRAVKPKRVTEQGIKAREEAKARHAAAQKMKTPMQLRWEQEHAKKLLSQKKAPLITTDALMAALGQHLQKAKAAKRNQRVAKAEELD